MGMNHHPVTFKTLDYLKHPFSHGKSFSYLIYKFMYMEWFISLPGLRRK
jgi:hypothetical protein